MAAVISSVPTSLVPSPPARSGVRRPCASAASTACVQASGVLVLPEAVTQHHPHREQRRQGVRLARAGDVGSRPVHGLEQARPFLPQACRWEHPQRAGQHRRLVAEDVPEQVLGDDHVEVGGARDKLHRGVVDQQMVQFDAFVLRRQPGNGLPPQARGLEHVRLVHGGHPAVAFAGGLERHPGDPLNLRDGVRTVVMGAVAIAPGIPEVDAARELADDEQVGALDSLPPQRACLQQRVAGSNRAQVREQSETLAKPEQSLLGARRIGVGGVPLRPPHRTEQDRIRGPARLEYLVGERDAIGVDRGASDPVFRDLEVAQGTQRLPRGSPDLGADPISRQQGDARA